MQSSLTYRTNRDLFSNYYLNEYLPETEEWDEVDEDKLEAAYDDIVALYNREKSTAPKRNESQLEEKFIRPMFRQLDIPFEVEESTSRTQRRPDYGFFESEDAARGAFERREEGGDFYEDAVAVADAKRWGRPLDTRGSGEHKRDFENPSYQIHVYLQETPAQWAILTDGKKWRLYYGPTSHRLDSYYEIDLPTVLETGDLEDFKYFYLFFRHSAFLEDASGSCFLDDVYDESNLFAQELGADLQDNIYEAIKVLSEGFMQYPDNDLSEDDLSLIHDSSLIYLYRLIFVLYAESEGRDLLDTNNEIYEESYSLNSLKQDIAEELDSPSPKYRDWQDTLWDRLDELFKLIDQGSQSRRIPKEDLYIPAYNGGLFRTNPDEDDSNEAKFLASHQVGDAYLAEVIELLTRSQNGNGGGKIFVDYSSLDVRHLGSIYEGLLEYQLDVADEPLALEDGEYVPAGEGDEVIVEEGEVHLSTGSGERKATGSYYTPEYVVEYIVEETLEPLVEDIRKDLAGQTAHGEGGFAQEFADRIFELKILDPAMGSGHFLTSAIDYLAREIIDAQEKQAAQEGIETVDEQRDINWARRQVAQRCIYGVDLNPLAVELAKVSLWLRTLAAEQPLAFLDHHLKTGNSLVGSDIETVLDNGDPDNGTEEGQLTLQQSFNRTRRQALEHVTDQFEDLLAIDNETLDDIKEMEAVYEEVRDDPLYQHLIAMANVHTAEQFGLDVPDDTYERMAEALRDDSWSDIEEQDWYKSAQTMADGQRFFHWGLEFPIAFYNQSGVRKEDSGFDAVIGNPPYVLINKSSKLGEYYESSFITASGYKPDLYMPFVEKSTGLTIQQGKIGLIVPNRFFLTKSGENMREFLSDCGVSKIIDFGQSKVFGDALNYVCILSFSPSLGDREDFTYAVSDASMSDLQSYELSTEMIQGDTWSLPDEELIEITQKIDSSSAPLGNILNDMFAGAQTGADKILLRGKPIKGEEEIFVPFLRSKDIRRYRTNRDAEYVIFPYDNEGDILSESDLSEKYPKTHEYLKSNQGDLENRIWHDQGPVERSGEWYGLMYLPDPEKFISNKIVCPYLASKTVFAYDTDESIFGTGAGYGMEIPGSEDRQKSFVCLLNSTLVNTLFTQLSPEFQSGFKFNKTYVEKIPIPVDIQDDFDVPIDAVSRQGGEARERSEDSVGDLLSTLYDTMHEAHTTLHSFNLSLLDYLGISSEELPESKAGDTLEDLQMPVSGVADTPLTKTTDEYKGLRVERVSFRNDSARLVLSVDVSYKVDEDDPRETDSWDRLAESEFETYEAMAFVGLSEPVETLLREFVPAAVDKAEGFAGFRQGATKTNSPLDRLKDLTLPDIDEVQTGLEQYIEVRERADELEEKIEKTDRLIDEIVYDLYELTDEEIEIVESAVQDD
jgi:type II restriction/modification system DNA methylase subunit YeeA